MKVMIIAIFLMFLFEILFMDQLPISSWLESWITTLGDDKWLLGIIIWLIMFIQVCLIPIPAVIVLNAAIASGIIAKDISTFLTWNCWWFILIVLSAYIIGAMVAYFIGLKWGKRAVKWCAGSDEDYKKWSNLLNEKGKWWYAASVFLPIFPDDLLCLVAGSTKFNFSFFFWINLIGRGIGLVAMLFSLVLLSSTNSGGFPFTVVAWGIIFIIAIIAYLIIQKQIKNENKSRAESSSITKMKEKEILSKEKKMGFFKKQKREIRAKRVYIANALFSEADFNYNELIASKLEEFGFDIYLPQRNFEINDKTKNISSTDIYTQDREKLINADYLIAILDHEDAGVGTEIGIFSELIKLFNSSKGIVPKKIIGLFTDSRESSKTFSDEKVNSLKEICENQFIYTNAFQIGAIKENGIVFNNKEDLFDYFSSEENTLR